MHDDDGDRWDAERREHQRHQHGEPDAESLASTAEGLRADADDLERRVADGHNPLAPHLTDDDARSMAQDYRRQADALDGRSGIDTAPAAEAGWWVWTRLDGGRWRRREVYPTEPDADRAASQLIADAVGPVRLDVLTIKGDKPPDADARPDMGAEVYAGGDQ